MLNGNPRIIPWDQGRDNTMPIKPEPKDPNKDYLVFRNVTIYIEPAEAAAALRRYNAEGKGDQ
jgi:hypothetical protein